MKTNGSSAPRRKDDDRWNVSDDEFLDPQKWNDLSASEKVERVLSTVLRTLALFFVIFCFICTLGVLADAFKLISGRGIGNAIRSNQFIRNPISASIIGMVATLILQSGSTLSTILVGMVASEMLTVHQAVPMIIGSEMGASFMNTLISLGQSGNRDQFRRAFAAATMNDIYNFLCYIVILPIEIAFGFIESIGELLVEPLAHSHSPVGQFRALSALTDPVINKIIQIDTNAINDFMDDGRSARKFETFVFRCIDLKTREELVFCPYDHLFAQSLWSDTTIGILLLVGSVAALICCLVGIVRLVQALLAGHIAVLMRRLMDRRLPSPFGCLTDYLVMLAGCLIVIVVQSSSVFRSALTPLVGIGVVPLERFYALVLGGNVGTTFTGVLAALAADPAQLHETMQLAICQTVYNLLGILIFYPIPQTRVPIPLSMRLGDITARYRWFAYAYIFVVFFGMPTLLVALSFLPQAILVALVSSLFTFICLVVLLIVVQRNFPSMLPACLRSWAFLPRPMRSLQPYDRCMSSLFASIPCCGDKTPRPTNRRRPTVATEHRIYPTRPSALHSSGSTVFFKQTSV